jgi:hypothetical protein
MGFTKYNHIESALIGKKAGCGSDLFCLTSNGSLQTKLPKNFDCLLL